MLARSVTLNFAGQVGQLAIGFVTSVILARWLGADDRGLLALMTSVANLTLIVGGLGLPFAVMFYASRREQRLGPLFGNSLLYAFGLGAAVVPLTWLLHEPVADLLARGRGGLVWVIAAVWVPILFFEFSVHNQLLGRLRFGFFNALTLATKVLMLALTVVLVGVLDLGVAGGVLVLVLGSLIVIAGALPTLLGYDRPRLERALFGDMLRYGARAQLGTLFQVLNYRLDVLILQFFRPLREVGQYVVAQLIAELVIVLSRSFQSSVLPLVARLEGDAQQVETTKASIRHHGLLALVAVVGNAVVGPLLIWYAFGPEFHDALVPMLILLPGMWFLGTGNLVASDLRGRRRPGLASLLSGAVVVLTVVLDLVLIPAYGLTGAAIASLAAYTVFGIASLVALARVSNTSLRELAVPTRGDLAAYGRLIRRLQRSNQRSADAGRDQDPPAEL